MRLHAVGFADRGKGLMDVGGHRQPRTQRAIQSGQDRDGVYAAACHDLAEALGFHAGEVSWWWSQIALAREYECGQSRDVAEDGAWHNVRDALNKKGQEGS
jgi:hypothetical protein